jgi:hypothetical protein
MTERPRNAVADDDTMLDPASSTSAEDADQRLAELEARLERLEGSPGLRDRGRGLMSRVIPGEATRHFRNAGREQLLGVRAIVDFWIDRIDESEGGSAPRSRHESIEID